MDLWIDGSFMIPAGFDERFLGDVRFELERFFLLMWFLQYVFCRRCHCSILVRLLAASFVEVRISMKCLESVKCWGRLYTLQ